MAPITPAKWHGGVTEKVLAGVVLGILAFAWSAGATAVERLGKVPQLQMRIDGHDSEIRDLKQAMETEAKGRSRLIELLEAAVERDGRKRANNAGGR